jgi:hypothetical protein
MCTFATNQLDKGSSEPISDLALILTEIEHVKYFADRYFRPQEVRAKLCDRGCFCPPRTGFGFNIIAETTVNGFLDNNVGTPQPCPLGTYTDEFGTEREGDCKICPKGAYCDQIISSTDLNAADMYPGNSFNDAYAQGRYTFFAVSS